MRHMYPWSASVVDPWQIYAKEDKEASDGSKRTFSCHAGQQEECSKGLHFPEKWIIASHMQAYWQCHIHGHHHLLVGCEAHTALLNLETEVTNACYCNWAMCRALD
jgi:hypothetical protein